jgi:hypothetical protein
LFNKGRISATIVGHLEKAFVEIEITVILDLKKAALQRAACIRDKPMKTIPAKDRCV